MNFQAISKFTLKSGGALLVLLVFNILFSVHNFSTLGYELKGRDQIEGLSFHLK